MIEQVLFLLVAFVLFILVFSKIIKRNDSNYTVILVCQAVGIAICFFEITLGKDAFILLRILRYVFSIILPIVILILEARGIFFSELFNVLLAKFYLRIGNTKKAKDILVKFVSKYPESYDGHKLLAEVYEKEGGMRKAIDEYVTVLDIKGNDYDSYFKIASLLKDLGKDDESIEMLQNLLKTKPDYYNATKLLGDILCKQERFKEAASIYQDALKYHSADFDLYYNLGIVFTRLNDFAEAKDMYEKAAELNHELYGAYYNLGQICFIEKDLDGAEKYFEKSLYGDDLEAMSYYQLAKINVMKGYKEKAISFINKAIELEPKLLKKAEQEKVFSEIKGYITVSVKMDDKDKNEVDLKKDNNEEEKDIEPDEPVQLEIDDEHIAQKHLEETTDIVQTLNENTISEKVTNIINTEKLKRIALEDENDDKENDKNLKEKTDKNA